MDEVELFQRMGVALAIGLLIGLERGWQTRGMREHGRTAGLRTFALTGLMGGIAALVASHTSPLVLAAALLAYTAALVVFTYLAAIAEQNFSVTGVVAALLTFLLGAYAIIGNETAAVAAAVVMAILLALRDTLHTWVRAITWPEMRSGLVLLAMSFLLLPVLPNRMIDPWQVLNPAEIWFLAILIAGVSMVGYIAVRVMGERRGLLVAAIAGGLASSTATTASFARIAREQPQGGRVLAAGVLLAGVVMMLRILVLVALLHPPLLVPLAAPIAAAVLCLVTATALLQWTAPTGGQQPRLELRSPFDLGTVLWLALLIGGILLAAKGLSDSIGQTGTLLLAAVSGIADVDALTLSMTRLAGSGIALQDAAAAILVAAGVNTMSKAVMALIIGGRPFGTMIIATSLLTLGAMAGAWALFG